MKCKRFSLGQLFRPTIWFEGFILVHFTTSSYAINDDKNLIIRSDGVLENAAALIPRTLKNLNDKIFNASDAFSDKFLDFYAPVNAKTEACRNDSLLYRESLKNYDYWALSMWDSSGKIPTGLLQLNFFDMGNYPGCFTKEFNTPMDVQFCMLRFDNWAPTWDISGFNWTIGRNFWGSARVLLPEFVIGRCLPASCTNEDLIEHYTDFLSPVNITVKVDEYSCTSINEPWGIGNLDILCLFLYSAITVIIFIGTVIDFTYLKGRPTDILPLKIILCFSLYRNMKKLFARIDPNQPLTQINGLRTIAMIMIVYAHNGVNLSSVPKINYYQLLYDHYEWFSLQLPIYSTFNKAVDVFFVISGFLISYQIIMYKNKGHKFNIFVYYLNRIIRLVPPLSFQILTFVTIFYHIAGHKNGPLWKYQLGISKDYCIENWWTNLLFINNIVNKDKMCIAVDWYLAVDTQLYVLTPFMLFPMLRSKFVRKFGLPFLIILCDTYTFYLSYANQYRAGSIMEHNYRTEKTNQEIYILTTTRVGCWVLGLYLGYFLHNIDKFKFQLSKFQVRLFWTITALVPFLELFFMRYFMATNEVNLLHYFHNGYIRTLYGFTFCWIIFACEMGYAGYLKNILSSHPMQILGKLTFSTYLIQESLLYGIDSMTITTLQIHGLRDFRDNLANVILCFALALYFSMSFEVPFINLGKLIFKAPKPKTEKKIPLSQPDPYDKIGSEKMNGNNQSIFMISNSYKERYITKL